MRVPAEDRRQVEVSVEGVVYRQRDGFFDMPERHAMAQLQAGGFGRSWQVAPPPRTRRDYRCPQCDRRLFFKRCSRCDVDCVEG
jgi:hypothetical protein